MIEVVKKVVRALEHGHFMGVWHRHIDKNR